MGITETDIIWQDSINKNECVLFFSVFNLSPRRLLHGTAEGDFVRINTLRQNVSLIQASFIEQNWWRSANVSNWGKWTVPNNCK